MNQFQQEKIIDLTVQLAEAQKLALQGENAILRLEAANEQAEIQKAQNEALESQNEEQRKQLEILEQQLKEANEKLEQETTRKLTLKERFFGKK